MAQIVKLKRTSISGKVPTVSNIELGELAMNTYDGRIFFEKNDGSATVQEILTTNAGRAITGSININGAITASYFKGDGSQLTNVSTDIGEVATVSASFDNSATINVGHNFSTKNVIVSVYDNNDNQIIPQTVSLTDSDNVRVVLSAAQSGFVVVAKGGHVVSGSADNSNQLNGQTGGYYLNYNNFTNVPSGLVSGSSQITLSSTTGYNSNEHFTQANITTVGTVTSGNINAILPSGVISGSTQITDGSGIVSSSAFTSPSQGTVRATLNGTQTDVDTGLQTSDSPQFTNLTLTGDLTVQGTTTTISSTTVNIGDNILELNYGGSATTSGLLTKDATGGSTTSGSLLWDATNDYWKAGKLGSEEEILLRNTHGVISGSSQIDHDSTTNFVANEHIDHSTVSIIAGEGLNGGGTIASSRTLNVDSSYKNTSLNSFTQSAITVSGNGSTNILPRFSDTHEVENSKITSTDTLTTFTHSNHGNIIFTVSGSNGELLTVTDSNSGNLLEVNDTSGVDVFTVSAVGDVSASGAITASGITGLTSLNVNGNIYGSSFNGTGLVSGSSQVLGGTGILSSSNETFSEFSSSVASDFSGLSTDYNNLQNIPSGIISGSGTTNHIAFYNSENGLTSHDYLKVNPNFNLFLYDSVSYSDAIRIQMTGSLSILGGISAIEQNSTFSNAYFEDIQAISYTGDGSNLTFGGTGLLSGSSQITNLTTHKETVSGASSYAVTHNLNEQYPIVQAWNTSTSQQELPTSVTTNSVNQVTVVFSTTFAGIIIVKK